MTFEVTFTVKVQIEARDTDDVGITRRDLEHALKDSPFFKDADVDVDSVERVP